MTLERYFARNSSKLTGSIMKYTENYVTRQRSVEMLANSTNIGTKKVFEKLKAPIKSQFKAKMSFFA